jgi:hypothetical protein
METGNTTSLLSAAGFRTRTPQTAKQKELYAALPSNKLEHATVKGKGFYVFKDEKAGVAYIGGEPEHQRYQQLCVQQHVAQPPEEEMSHPFAQAWSTQWGGGRDFARWLVAEPPVRSVPTRMARSRLALRENSIL